MAAAVAGRAGGTLRAAEFVSEPDRFDLTGPLPAPGSTIVLEASAGTGKTFAYLVPALLSPRGALYMVAVTDNDVPELLRSLERAGLHSRVCLMRAADEEKLHIIAARRE